MPNFHFDNRFTNQPLGDPGSENVSRQVLNARWSAVSPTPVSNPKMLAYSKEVANQLAFTDAFMQSSMMAQVLAGNALLDGTVTYATCYSGHQFGHWAGQLGGAAGRGSWAMAAIFPDKIFLFAASENEQSLKMIASAVCFAASLTCFRACRSSLRNFKIDVDVAV